MTVGLLAERRVARWGLRLVARRAGTKAARMADSTGECSAADLVGSTVQWSVAR